MTNESHVVKDGKGIILFELSNCGVGSAIIKNFKLLFGDKEVAVNNSNSYSDYLESLVVDCEEKYTGSLVPGAALQAGGSHILFTFKYNLGNKDISFVDKLNLVVDYHSIYEDEILTYDSRNDRKFHGRDEVCTPVDRGNAA